MGIFNNAARLTLALLGAGVSASAIGPVELPKRDGQIGGPGGDPYANITHVICQPTDYVFAMDNHLGEGMNYLHGLTGSEKIGSQAGGGFCTRVSCSENSGIYVCNDNDVDTDVYYDTMAAYTQYVIDYKPPNDSDPQCTWYQKYVDGSYVSANVSVGQVFDSNGFNVVVGMLAGTNC